MTRTKTRPEPHFHWRERVARRAPGTCPKRLWHALFDAIEGQDDSRVRFFCKTKVRGRVLYRFELNGDALFAVWDRKIGTLITLLDPDGSTVSRTYAKRTRRRKAMA